MRFHHLLGSALSCPTGDAHQCRSCTAHQQISKGRVRQHVFVGIWTAVAAPLVAGHDHGSVLLVTAAAAATPHGLIMHATLLLKTIEQPSTAPEHDKPEAAFFTLTQQPHPTYTFVHLLAAPAKAPPHHSPLQCLNH